MPRLRMIEGPARSQKRVAMSIVHPLGRLDLASRAILFVEANAVCTFAIDDQAWDHERPHIAIGLDACARAKLHRMTSTILASDQADVPVAIWVGDRCVNNFVVREPLGKMPTFFLSAFTIEEAREHASILRSRCASPALRLVKP